MTRLLLIMMSCLLNMACSDDDSCMKYGYALESKYNDQKFADRETRVGQPFIIEQGYAVRDKLGRELISEEDIYLILKNEMNETERNAILSEFGPYLLYLSMYTSVDQIKFYLDNGIDALVHHKYLGVPMASMFYYASKNKLPKIHNKQIQKFKFFKDYYQKRNIRSEIFDDVEAFFEKCYL